MLKRRCETEGSKRMNTTDPLNQQRHLMLSQRDKKIMGVCGGIAAYMGWDATAVRIITVLLLFPLHLTLVIAYLILGAVLKSEPAAGYPPNQYPPQQPPTQHPYD
jgi:phage shock protein C